MIDIVRGVVVEEKLRLNYVNYVVEEGRIRQRVRVGHVMP